MLHRLPPAPAWSAAIIAALIGFGGTVALVVQASQSLGASVAEASSAVTALCLGIGIAGGALSLWLRMPIVLAWSTPGAALLAATAGETTWPVAIGAFLASGVLMICLGAVPALGRLAERIPRSVASAMLAGILLPFCLALFRVAGHDLWLVATVVIVFLAARQRVPLYALLLAIGTGTAMALLRGNFSGLAPGATFGALFPVAPMFRVAPLVSIAVPLFLVTLVSQNLPGLAVLRTAGYRPRAGLLMSMTGLATVLTAPFGAHSVNLAAITAAICTNEDAHPQHARRWTVGVLYAGCYVVLGMFSPLLVRVFLALPHDVIAALTGVALIPALMGALEGALAERTERDAAIVTFLATGSGLTLFGLGAAFWGLVAGFAALAIAALLKQKPAAPSKNEHTSG